MNIKEIILGIIIGVMALFISANMNHIISDEKKLETLQQNLFEFCNETQASYEIRITQGGNSMILPKGAYEDINNSCRAMFIIKAD